MSNEKAPVSPKFLQVISAKTKEEENQPIPANMEFPLLDEMEMDIPMLGDYLSHEREFPEDDSDFGMQCLMYVNPSLAMSSLSV